MDNGFKKAERLNSKKDIECLFKGGNKLFSYPYKIQWFEFHEAKDKAKVQIMISVSKRGFKKAVDRNQIKRYIREAYRTQKSLLWDSMKNREGVLKFAIIYIEKEIKDFHFHESAMEKMLQKLSKEILSK